MRVAGAVAAETSAGVAKTAPRTVRSGETEEVGVVRSGETEEVGVVTPRAVRSGEMEEVGVVAVGNRTELLSLKVGGKP